MRYDHVLQDLSNISATGIHIRSVRGWACNSNGSGSETIDSWSWTTRLNYRVEDALLATIRVLGCNPTKRSLELQDFFSSSAGNCCNFGNKFNPYFFGLRSSDDNPMLPIIEWMKFSSRQKIYDSYKNNCNIFYLSFSHSKHTKILFDVNILIPSSIHSFILPNTIIKITLLVIISFVRFFRSYLRYSFIPHLHSPLYKYLTYMDASCLLSRSRERYQKPIIMFRVLAFWKEYFAYPPVLCCSNYLDFLFHKLEWPRRRDVKREAEASSMTAICHKLFTYASPLSLSVPRKCFVTAFPTFLFGLTTFPLINKKASRSR